MRTKFTTKPSTTTVPLLKDHPASASQEALLQAKKNLQQTSHMRKQAMKSHYTRNSRKPSTQTSGNQKSPWAKKDRMAGFSSGGADIH
mmetsp:Transcript_26369/g.40254  ORF Transcript_26369/g.40254 Transcript_26369/m.40254 type:complete len:88 (-) Transcript_26369:8415-8678(-)